MKKVSLIISITIVIAIIAVVGYLTWKNFSQQIGTAGWKTYTNTTYNYKISYDSLSVIKENTNGQMSLNYKNSTLEVCFMGGFDACGNVPGVGSSEIKNITKQQSIDGKIYTINGYIYQGNEYLHLSLPNNMFVSLNIIKADSSVERNLLKTLSTFTFVSPTNEVSNLKTYNNYGISFSYPLEWGVPVDGIGNKGGALYFDNGFTVDYGETILGEYKGAAGSNIETFDELVKSQMGPSVKEIISR